MTNDDTDIIEQLDALVRDPRVVRLVRRRIDDLTIALDGSPERQMAWSTFSADEIGSLPPGIGSSWCFLLRANATTGAERHPNSHQRMVSFDGHGDFPSVIDGAWVSHPLVSDLAAPLWNRWVSIPPNVWHQGVVGPRHWAVVSFHTVAAAELLEERPAADDTVVQKKYV
jgi:hypothetical protein